MLDDYSRFIIEWKLFRSTTTNDVTEVLDSAIERTGVEHVPFHHPPKQDRTRVTGDPFLPGFDARRTA